MFFNDVVKVISRIEKFNPLKKGYFTTFEKSLKKGILSIKYLALFCIYKFKSEAT